MKKNEYGVFELNLPAQNGQAAIPHNSQIKVSGNRWFCTWVRELTMARFRSSFPAEKEWTVFQHGSNT